MRTFSPGKSAFLFLALLAGYRFWFVGQLGLVPDEAYYWLWSKHLAASYRDKGPAIGWTIALGTKLFGDTVFGIRFFAIVLSAGIGWLVFVLARTLYGDRIAWWSLLTASVLPIVAVGSILMTIDSLSLFFWALAALYFWRGLNSEGYGNWILLGLSIGAGFLAKFTNGVQIGCVMMFLLWSRERRALLLSRKMMVMLGAFLVAILPVIWWNMQTGWIHAGALHSRSGVTNSFHVRPGQLFRFVGEQFGVMSPLFMAGMAVAAVGLTLRRNADERVRFLLSQFLPVYGLFLFFSLNSAGKPNWTAPALVTGGILTVVYWDDLVSRKPAWRWGVRFALGIALLMTLALHNTEILHLPPKKDPMRRAQGWPDFAKHVQAAREAGKVDLLIGNHYSQASMMSFYLPDKPVTYLLPEAYGETQFTLWPGYTLTSATRALFVTDSQEGPPGDLSQEFSSVTLVDDFFSQHHGRPMGHFRIYLCSAPVKK